jgi:pimeloyl-ACP methyl ester carboxylesterase
MKSYTVTANGIRQFVVEEGEGAPVILLHGFPETNYAWRYQIPVLSRHYRVIAPDLRGYGETDKPASGYDKRNMARDIRELMRVWVYRKWCWWGTIAARASRRGLQKITLSWWIDWW